ncbi:MAG: hypothetical protein FWH19_05240 [Treponema sp.]|nr:hypothetical protein [Treponema sp.]
MMLFFIAAIALLPRFALGPSLAGSFLQLNMHLLVILALIFCAFCIFYFRNLRLFSLLEKEDWPALVRYLEDRVIQKGKYSPRLLRLLANSYLVLADAAAVMVLENKTAAAKPALLDDNALIFGTARILAKDISGAERFFETRKATAKPRLREWVYWYHGFSLLLGRQYEKAAGEFSALAQTAKNGVVCALSSYFLSSAIAPHLGEKGPELENISQEGRKRALKALNQRDWNRELSRISSEIHVAAISRYMEETSRWLYP